MVQKEAVLGAAEGLLVIAGSLSQARGRLGRSFFTSKGGLYFSVLLRPILQTIEAPLVSLAAGVAVACGIEETTGLATGLKWPNDCVVQGRKVCGVLLEASSKGEMVEYMTLGAGINANFSRITLPAELRERATTLQEELGHPVLLPGLLNSTLLHFEDLYYRIQNGLSDDLLGQWRRRDVLAGRLVEVEAKEGRFQARARGIGKDGSLLLESGNRLLSLTSGEATLL